MHFSLALASKVTLVFWSHAFLLFENLTQIPLEVLRTICITLAVILNLYKNKYKLYNDIDTEENNWKSDGMVVQLLAQADQYPSLITRAAILCAFL